MYTETVFLIFLETEHALPAKPRCPLTVVVLTLAHEGDVADDEAPLVGVRHGLVDVLVEAPGEVELDDGLFYQRLRVSESGCCLGVLQDEFHRLLRFDDEVVQVALQCHKVLGVAGALPEHGVRLGVDVVKDEPVWL